jgi:hypothetical protein
LLVAVAAAGCGPEEPVKVTSKDSKVRVLLVGLDGASWNLMEPMLARGELPNLSKMIDEGVSAPLRSELPCLSIVLWTSIATGKRPAAHGVEDWSYRNEETGESGLMSSSRRRVEALWNLMSRAGLGAGFVNWWATWPAESIDGYIVSERYTRMKPGEALARATYPEELAERLKPHLREEWPWLRRRLEEGTLRVLSDRDPNSSARLAERFRQAMFLYGQDVYAERIAFDLLASAPRPHLFALLSRKVDIASHYMWEFGGTRRPDDEALSRLLAPVYAYEDELLGRLMSEVGPQANVIVVSDHGFTWEENGLGHEASAPDGIFIATGPAFKSGVRLDSASLYDIAPTVLHLSHMPVGEDMVGKVLTHALSEEREPRFIATYETGERRTGSHEIESPLDERILDELRALGYIK